MLDGKLDVLDLDFEQRVDIIHYTLELISFVCEAKMSKTNEEIMYKILDLNEVIDGMFETWDLAIEDENTDDFQVYLALENMIEAETRLCMQFLGVSIEEILEDIKFIDK